jgi:glycosyltransferase involved in cell wall biosynthesis
VDHETAIGWMQHSDVLLLLNGESVNIPGKLFEYLGVGRPVLALMPRGPAAAILRENEAGTTIPPDDAPRIAGALEDLHRRWRSGALEAAPRTPPARFTREATARSLARLFDEVRDDVATGRGDGDVAAGAAGPGHRGGHGTGERKGARVSG